MRLFQSERDLCLDVLASHGKARARASAVTAAKKSLKAIAEGARTTPASTEGIAKVAELDPHIPPAGRGREVFACFPVLPELVVPLALLGVGQHFVGFVYPFESLFCGFVSRVNVRVKLARQLSVRLLDLILGRRFGNAQDFIVISKLHRHRSSLLSRTLVHQSENTMMHYSDRLSLRSQRNRLHQPQKRSHEFHEFLA